MASVLVWADIPVVDMDRAIKFYGKVLQVELVQPLPGQHSPLLEAAIRPASPSPM